jgi:hypothetical protein|tara:strand:+ start:104 stop:559 length:456 start_codon:yes stop_codon:yes gene_type:complete
MDFSYKEKSLIASLGVTLLVFGWYFYAIFSNLTLIENQQLNLNLLIYAIILIVILEIIIHSFLAIRNRNYVEDERDKTIEIASYRHGYWTLSIGIWLLLFHLAIEGSGTWNFYHNLVFTSPAYLANLLLLFFVLSEVISFITQLYYYRKGV